MLIVHGQQHSFSTHERVFLWNCQSFWDRKFLDLRRTRIPNLRIHAECSNHLSYQGRHLLSHLVEYWLWRIDIFQVKLTSDMLTMHGQQHSSLSTYERMFLWRCQSFWDRKCVDPRRGVGVAAVGETSGSSFLGHSNSELCSTHAFVSASERKLTGIIAYIVLTNNVPVSVVYLFGDTEIPSPYGDTVLSSSFSASDSFFASLASAAMSPFFRTPWILNRARFSCIALSTSPFLFILQISAVWNLFSSWYNSSVWYVIFLEYNFRSIFCTTCTWSNIVMQPVTNIHNPYCIWGKMKHDIKYDIIVTDLLLYIILKHLASSTLFDWSQIT